MSMLNILADMASTFILNGESLIVLAIGITIAVIKARAL